MVAPVRLQRRTDRPIIMSAPMVRAILREVAQPGTGKTQTRRILKPQPEVLFCASEHLEDLELQGLEAIELPGGRHTVFRPRWFVGDRLWVREAHALLPRTAYRGSIGTGKISQREHPTDGYTAAVFREGFDRSGRPLWRPSIHMPRWASRLTLIVSEVRVERLQDISEADAVAEGVHVQRPAEWAAAGQWVGEGNRPILMDAADPSVVFMSSADADCAWSKASEAFAEIWEGVHGPGAWDANPWVAVITFRPALANIDALAADALPATASARSVG